MTKMVINKFQPRGFGGWILTAVKETDDGVKHPTRFVMTPRSFEEFVTNEGYEYFPMGDTPACTDTGAAVEPWYEYLGITEKAFTDWLNDNWSDELVCEIKDAG